MPYGVPERGDYGDVHLISHESEACLDLMVNFLLKLQTRGVKLNFVGEKYRSSVRGGDPTLRINFYGTAAEQREFAHQLRLLEELNIFHWTTMEVADRGLPVA